MRRMLLLQSILLVAASFSLAPVRGKLPDSLVVSLEVVTTSSSPSSPDLIDHCPESPPVLRVTLRNHHQTDRHRVVNISETVSVSDHGTFRINFQDETERIGASDGADQDPATKFRGPLVSMSSFPNHDIDNNLALLRVVAPRVKSLSAGYSGFMIMDVSPSDHWDFKKVGTYNISMAVEVRLLTKDNVAQVHIVETNHVRVKVTEAIVMESHESERRLILKPLEGKFKCTPDDEKQIDGYLYAGDHSLYDALQEASNKKWETSFLNDVKGCFVVNEQDIEEWAKKKQPNIINILTRLRSHITSTTDIFNVNCDTADATDSCKPPPGAAAGIAGPNGYVVGNIITLCSSFFFSPNECAFAYQSPPNILMGLLAMADGAVLPKVVPGATQGVFNGKEFAGAVPNLEDRFKSLGSWQCFVSTFSKSFEMTNDQCKTELMMKPTRDNLARDMRRITEESDIVNKLELPAGIEIEEAIGAVDSSYKMDITYTTDVVAFKTVMVDSFKKYLLDNTGKARTMYQMANVLEGDGSALPSEVGSLQCDKLLPAVDTLLRVGITDAMKAIVEAITAPMMDGWLHGNYDLSLNRAGAAAGQPKSQLGVILAAVAKANDRLVTLRFLLARLRRCTGIPANPANQDLYARLPKVALAVSSAIRAIKINNNSFTREISLSTLFTVLTGMMQNFGVDKAHRPEQALYLALRRGNKFSDPQKKAVFHLLSEVYGTVSRVGAIAESYLGIEEFKAKIACAKWAKLWDQFIIDCSNFPVGADGKVRKVNKPESAKLIEMEAKLIRLMSGDGDDDDDSTVEWPVFDEALSCKNTKCFTHGVEWGVTNPLRNGFCDLLCDNAVCGNDGGDCSDYIKMVVHPNDPLRQNPVWNALLPDVQNAFAFWNKYIMNGPNSLPWEVEGVATEQDLASISKVSNVAKECLAKMRVGTFPLIFPGKDDPHYLIRGLVVFVTFVDFVEGEKGPIGACAPCSAHLANVDPEVGNYKRFLPRAAVINMNTANKNHGDLAHTPQKNAVYSKKKVEYTMRHELTHALGFSFSHRYHRLGEYVKIIVDNKQINLWTGEAQAAGDEDGNDGWFFTGPKCRELWETWGMGKGGVPLQYTAKDQATKSKGANGHHWRLPEFFSDFKELELMNKYGVGPLSQMTLRYLQDAGYTLKTDVPEDTLDGLPWRPRLPVRTKINSRRLDEDTLGEGEDESDDVIHYDISTASTKNRVSYTCTSVSPSEE